MKTTLRRAAYLNNIYTRPRRGRGNGKDKDKRTGKVNSGHEGGYTVDNRHLVGRMVSSVSGTRRYAVMA